jgi:hypothetical protein
MNIFTQFLSKSVKDPQSHYQDITRDLLRRESMIGKEIFGPIPAGGNREFFHLDKHTWVWVETWNDPSSKSQKSKTTKYIVKPTEVIKSVDGAHYERVTLEEAKRLEQAVQIYVKRVHKEVYGRSKKAL